MSLESTIRGLSAKIFVEGKRVLIPLVSENYNVTLLFENCFDSPITDRLLGDRHAACRVEPFDGIFF